MLKYEIITKYLLQKIIFIYYFSDSLSKIEDIYNVKNKWRKIMPKIPEFLLKSLVADNIWICFSILSAFYLIIKKEPFKIFTFFREEKNKDIEQAKSLLDNDKLSKTTREMLCEYLEQFSFKKFYGINADKNMRSILYEFYQRHQKEICWKDLQRARSYIKKTSESSIEVELESFYRINMLFASFSKFLYIALAICLFFEAIYPMPDNILNSISSMILAILLFVGAGLFESLKWPYESALKIRDCLQKEKKKN